MADKRRKKQPKKIRRVKKQMLGHLFFVVALLLLGFGVVIGNLVKYQIKDTAVYKKKVLSQQKYSSTTLNYRRGDIVDRKGSYLATSTKIYNLVLEPKNILKSKDYKKSKTVTYKDITIQALYKYFAFKQGEVEQILEEKPDSYYYIAFKDLTYDEVSAYMDYAKTDEGACVVGVSLEENYERTYPNKSAACQLIGYTSSGNVGNWGMEQQYNDILNGTEGRKYSYMTDEGTIETKVQDAVDGNSIVSTVDLNMQNIADQQVSKFMSEVGAANVSVLVMDPNNAEVLAMSNSKTYDLNDPYDESVLLQTYKEDEIAAMTDKEKLEALNEVWRNFIISDTYEPGSTFKPFTMSAALEEGIVRNKDTFYCGGSLKVGDYDIRCHNTDGTIDIEHAIAKSCNVTMMQINAKMGAELFTKYQSIFGFGQYTNIDLPGEESAEGLIYAPDKIRSTDLAINSFGQGFNCTMIQLCTGFCSLINGGNYYEPHVVKEIRNADGGTVESIEKKLVKKTISKATSKLIKKYMKTTVEEGTGTGCQIAGYEIGGKTGTAEKLPRNNGKYLLSFIGFAPYDDPQVVVYVTVDEINLSPQDQTSYAVHLARKIFKQILPYMGIEQKKVSDEEASKEIVNVNENGKVIQNSGDDAQKYLNENDDADTATTQGDAEDTTQASQATTETAATVTESSSTQAVTQ